MLFDNAPVQCKDRLDHLLEKIRCLTLVFSAPYSPEMNLKTTSSLCFNIHFPLSHQQAFVTMLAIFSIKRASMYSMERTFREQNHIRISIKSGLTLASISPLFHLISPPYSWSQSSFFSFLSLLENIKALSAK